MRAKKTLGQNFLKSNFILEKITEAARINSDDLVLEIGPGKGSLTERLLDKSKKVIAIEKDDRLIPFLREKFSEEIKKGNLELIHGDVLEFNLKEYDINPKNYKLVANIPYYLTGQIFRKFLETENQPNLAVLLVQKEVAKRIVSEKGSILSLSIKVFGKPKYVETVKKMFFKPKPKVDSAILLIDEISNPFKNTKEQDKFFTILKTGFSQKRKKLSGNLKKECKKEDLEKVFKSCNLEENVRAEELSLKDWKCLASKL